MIRHGALKVCGFADDRGSVLEHRTSAREARLGVYKRIVNWQASKAKSWSGYILADVVNAVVCHCEDRHRHIAGPSFIQSIEVIGTKAVDWLLEMTYQWLFDLFEVLLIEGVHQHAVVIAVRWHQPAWV